MGYRVTMGTVENDNYGMYFTKSWCLFDSAGDSIEGADHAPYVLNQSLQMEKNTIGSYECDIPYTIWHDRYSINPDELIERQIDVMVEEDGNILFMGYLTEKNMTLDRSIHIYMTDLLGALNENDMLLEPKSYTLTCRQDGTYDVDLNGTGEVTNPSLWYTLMFDAFTTNNIGVTNFEVPTVQRGTVKDLSDAGWQTGTAWAFVQEYFLDEYDGYLYVRYARPEKHQDRIEAHLEYRLDISEKTAQTIEYGKNLLDLEVTEKLPSNFCNYVFAWGTSTTTKGWWIFKKTRTQRIINSAYNATSWDKYGQVARDIVVDGNSTTDSLKQAAQEELNNHPQEAEYSVELTAYDMVDAGMQTDHIGFMKKTHVISKPHGVDGWYVCTKVSMDPADPGNKQYTFGNPPKKLSDQQNAAGRAVSVIKGNVAGVMSYLNT